MVFYMIMSKKYTKIGDTKNEKILCSQNWLKNYTTQSSDFFWCDVTIMPSLWFFTLPNRKYIFSCLIWIKFGNTKHVLCYGCLVEKVCLLSVKSMFYTSKIVTKNGPCLIRTRNDTFGSRGQVAGSHIYVL